MKVVILTTETPHHAFFVRELCREVPVEEVFLETRTLKPSFEITHPFEGRRKEYEREVWFEGHDALIKDFCCTKSFGTVNEPEAIDRLRKISPDLVLTFGTGKLGNEAIAIRPDRFVNFHGGNPEEYRGLDSHLWTIYHKDFSSLITTAHMLTTNLDTGDIILQTSLGLRTQMKLFELNAVNTQACLDMGKAIVQMILLRGSILSRPQQKKGRYYSFMPTVLKEVCVHRFEAHTKGLS